MAGASHEIRLREEPSSTAADLEEVANGPDPYPRYAELRRAGPLVRARVRGEEAWVVPGYEDCLALLTDPRFHTRGDPRLPFLFHEAAGGGSRERRLARALAPRAAEALGPRVAEAVEELLDAATDRGRLDLVHDFASPAAAVGPCELLGVAAGDRDLLAAWAAERKARDAADEALRAYFEEHVRGRRRVPGDDLPSAAILAGGEPDGGDACLARFCVAVLRAGHELTAALLAGGARALALHPDARRRLAERPRQAAAVVEECARWDAPVQLTPRTAACDLFFRGTAVCGGETVWALLGSANRDPELFELPDVFETARQGPPHLAFGFGTHLATGAHLARVTARIALRLLAGRLPELALAGPPDVGPPGPVRLPVRLPATLGR